MPMVRDWLISATLFTVTLATTTMAGWQYTGGSLLSGLYFSAPLMLILLTHEMGHYIMAKRHGIDVSPPYFIPVPFIGIGTFGAIIKIRSPIVDRNALIDVGAAGPWAGILMALPVLVYGLSMSEVRPVLPASGAMTEGNSIMYLAIKYAMFGRILPSGGYDVFLHPTAFAAWIGILVTMINLIPIGQLDGGHVAYGYFGNKYARFSKILHQTLPVLAILTGTYVYLDSLMAEHTQLEAMSSGLAASMPWFLWFVLLFLMKKMGKGMYHPPVEEDEASPGRRLLAIATGILFILIFMPVPIRVS